MKFHFKVLFAAAALATQMHVHAQASNLPYNFDENNLCINYLDLQGSNVTCTYGYYPAGNQSPFMNIGVVDFGPNSIDSRHTIHTDKTETDPRTGGLLHTVPEGAQASVRLGNWNVGTEAESITYDITVDAENNGILIIRYAIVLEDGSHAADNSQFDIRILDASGNQIDPYCRFVSFTSNDAANNSNWNAYQEQGTGKIIVWKDWATLGIDLTPYDGEDIRVRFTTMDCGLGTHFGYAYFTLDCADANMTYSTDSSNTVFFAPDGFAYAWTNEDGDTLSISRELTIDNSSNQTYTCTLTHLEESNCNFTISVQPEGTIDPNDPNDPNDPDNPKEAIDNTSFIAVPSAAKIINNGQLFIQRGDKTYTLQGQEIIVP